MATIFLTYGTDAFRKTRDDLCLSAINAGFDNALARGPEDLCRDFAKLHSEILSQPRGAGYWCWKPQIIKQELEKLRANDVLVYCDAGRSSYNEVRIFPSRLLEKARSLGFLVGPTIPQHGPIARWTKRDALILMEMDKPEVYTLPPVQATWSFWTATEEAFRFLSLWGSACVDPRCVTDQPNTMGLNNLEGFKDHRHDQAIASLLAYRESAPILDYSDTSLFDILSLRPKSTLSNFFLKRLDDAELMERGRLIRALYRAFMDLRQ